MGALLASGLVYSHKLVEYSVVILMITYLTSSLEESNLRKASIFVNIQDGISAASVIVITYISNTLFSRPKVISCSAIFTIAGLVMLASVASKEEESNSDSPSKETKNRRFLTTIIGIFLIAVGQAGVRALLGDFIADQLRAREPKTNKNEDRVEARKTVWWRGAWFFSVITSFLIGNYSWSHTFSFSAKATGATLIFFVGGTTWLHYSGKLAPAASHNIKVSPLNWIRLEDKATALDSSTLTPEERASPCDTENKLRILLNMIPMWSSFLVFGLVVSTADTFFPEQGDNLVSSHLYFCFNVLQSVSNKIISHLVNLFTLSKWIPQDKREKVKLVRIWIGMVLTIFCCEVAWRVEVRRLIVVKSKGLVDKPNDPIPMSIFWLAPQFCLLGLMQGIASDGLNEFLIDQLPKSWKDYASAINELVIGIGKLLSILFVDSNKRLFASTMNRSRLDEYYKRLTIVSFVNTCFYWPVYTFYTQSDRKRSGRSATFCGVV